MTQPYNRTLYVVPRLENAQFGPKLLANTPTVNCVNRMTETEFQLGWAHVSRSSAKPGHHYGTNIQSVEWQITQTSLHWKPIRI